MRILLVEDNISLGEALAEALADYLYAVDLVTDGKRAWHQVQLINYDLIILDVTLPEMDGITLCKRLRLEGYQMPVMMLTARDTSNDKVNGLDAGADDYVIKPIDLQELLARIRALLRRSPTALPTVLEWGQLRLDPSTYEVSYDGQPLHLTPKEYALLEFFIRNGRRVLSRSAIIEHIWSFEDPPEEDTIKTHIKSLRQKLKVIGAPNDFIETVHSVGYRLKQPY